jgi:hypothetical protein
VRACRNASRCKAKPAIIQDVLFDTDTYAGSQPLESFYMRFTALFLTLTCGVVLAQEAPKASSLKIVTVPLALDHNRVVINVDLQLPDGSTRQVRAWVDNGNPDLYFSRQVATLLGLTVTCGEKECTAPPPPEIAIGGVKISLATVKQVTIPLKPVSAAAFMAAGMNADINIPSVVLRNYDVLIDFPGRKFTIGQPGSVEFKGNKTKVIVNAGNGLIQIASQIENKKYNLGLDIGSSISFLSEELFDKLATTHPDWPHMTGAVGPANMWGLKDEPQWKLMRVDRLQYGPLFLTDVAMVELPKDWKAFFEKRAGIPTTGLLGAEACNHYRVGIDYAHSIVYFDIGRTFKFPEFDVVGLILRPEDDGRFTILAIADYDGKASVAEVKAGDQLVAIDGIPVRGSTMGQVWLMLGGEPGKERRLMVEREGKQFAVVAKVRRFLGEADGNNAPKGASR